MKDVADGSQLKLEERSTINETPVSIGLPIASSEPKDASHAHAMATLTFQEDAVKENRFCNVARSQPLPSVSVIVPCYNYGRFLPECIASILSQDGVNGEILIIDDASPDNSAEVAAELARENPRVNFLRHAVNKGHIATYNEGIEWASADYMLILSADDYLLPGALSRSANLMDEYAEVGFVYGNALALYDCGTTRELNTVVGKADRRILTGREFIELSGSRNIVVTPTAVVRTKLQKRLEGYRPALPHSGDMEMWLRLAAHASVGSLQEYQAVYRRHSGNMSLDYTAKTWLPDLQQRKAAFDCFFQTCSYALPNAQQLDRTFLWLLSCDAVGFASSAFNEGKMEVSEQLSEYALSVCPEVKGSLSWTKLACKRRMGYGAWRPLQPAVAGMRQVGLALKQLARFK